MATAFVGDLGVKLYTAATLAVALRFYIKHHKPLNRAWTPGRMMAKAGEITGKTFKSRDYQGAVDALEEWKDANLPEAITRGSITS